MLKTKRNKYMRFLFQLTAMILIAVLFAGCGKNTAASEDKPAEEVKSEDTILPSEQQSENLEQQDGNSDISGSPATASESYGAYIQAKGELVSRLSDALASNPETAFSSMSLLGISMVDLALLPASSFGLGEASANMALGFLGAEDIVYSENGNKYSVKYKGKDGSDYELQGEYDKTADALKCISLVDGKETLTCEHRRTSYGYVSQTYVIDDDGSTYVYKLTVSGIDGVVGMSQVSEVPSSLTGSESIDFPKQCQEWYAITGDKVTGVTADGDEISFSYTPSDGE